MRTTSMVAILVMGAVGWSTSVTAQGVRLVGDASQEFRFDNNFNFASSGTSLRAFTRGNIGIESETETTRVFASTGLVMSVNPGGAGVSVSTPSFRLGAQTRTRLMTFVVGGSYVTGPVTVEELQSDLSLVRITSDQTRISGNAAVARVLSQTTRVGMTASVSRLEFEVNSPDLVPSTDANLGFNLNHQLSDITSVGLELGLGIFEGEGIAESESTSFSINGTFNHQLDTRTRVTGNLGAAFVETEETVGAVRVSDDITSVLFGAGLDYALSDGSVNVALSHAIGPSASGALELNTGLSAAYEQQLNSIDTLGLSAGYATQSDLDGDNRETIFSVSPSYARQLTRDVEMLAAYTLSRNDSGDVAHGVSVEFSTELDRLLR